jgi:hypothetical protein
MKKKKSAVKDPRFETTSALLNAGGAKDFYMHMQLPAFTKCMQNPRKFTIEEIERLAELFNYPFDKMLKLILREIKNPDVNQRRDSNTPK